ncbi:hypothetical protein JCM8097_006504 [Rhodosporidiobolus ruineniae]
MPPTRSHHAPSSSSASSSKSAVAPSSASAPSHRRRKGVPKKSPTSTSTPSTPSSSAIAINAPVLLKLLLRDGASSSASLDNRRFKLPAKPPVKKVKQGQRDQLLPSNPSFGRGQRKTARSLSDDFVDPTLPSPAALSSVGTHRGRSPSTRVVGSGRGTPYGAAGAGTGGRATSRRALSAASEHAYHDPYIAPYASAGPSSISYGVQATNGTATGKMSRAHSQSSANPHLAPPLPLSSSSTPAAQYAYGAPVPSPLARSFSANGAVTSDREARQRTPSSNGFARVAELGGHGLTYSPAANYVAA